MRNKKVSLSLIGKFGNQSRRWKGDSASYVAKHMWIKKHFTKSDSCDFCKTKNVSRLEWANKSGKHKRIRDDWMTLCPSCHRKHDLKLSKITCINEHEYTLENTYVNSRGHRECRICRSDSKRRYANAKAN